jgi:hypothetical protein
VAGSIADISIKVIANANGVGPGLNKAERELLKFDAEARRIGSSGAGGLASFAKSVTGLGAALGGLAIGSAVTETINRLDDLGDFADGIGDTAANVAKLHFAAEQLGSSAEAVDSTMAKMVKSIGAAAAAGGDAEKAFTEIGLSIADLEAMRPTEAFKTVVEAIGQMPNAYQKAYAASKIFGKGAIEILSVLKAGGGEIDAFGQRLEELHAAPSDEEIEAAAKMKDTLVETAKAWDGVKNSAAQALGPALILGLKGTQLALDAIWVTTQFIKGVFGVGAFFPKESARASNTKSNKKEKEFENALRAQREQEEASKKLDEAAKKVLDEIKTAEQEYDEKKSALAELFETGRITLVQYQMATDKYIRELDEAIEARNKMMDKVGEVSKVEQKNLDEMGEAWARAFTPGGQKAAQGKVNDLKSDINEHWNKIGEQIERETRTPLENYGKRVEEINKAFEAGAISQETYARAAVKAWKDMQSAMGAGVNFADAGGDMPGMSGSGMSDAAWQSFMDYNMPRGGFVGGVIPDNFRAFSDPVTSAMNGGRQVFNAQDFSSIASQYQAGDQGGNIEDPSINYLRQIAENTAQSGVYA